MRSPKDKYSANITFDKYVNGIGQSITLSGNTIDDLKSLVVLSSQGIPAYVEIKENKDIYPKFRWIDVESYKING